MNNWQQGSVSTCLAVDARIIRPKETWADDPEMRAAIVVGGAAMILGIGLCAIVQPDGRRAHRGSGRVGGAPSVAAYSTIRAAL